MRKLPTCFIALIAGIGFASAQSALLSDAFVKEMPVNEQFTRIYRSPMHNDDGTVVITIDEWEAKRADIRQEWMQIIGGWEDCRIIRPLTPVDSTDIGGITRYTVECEWLPGMTTTGYLLVPDSLTRPAGAVITLYYEPETSAGMSELPNRDFALQLARRGLITLSLGSTETTRDKTYGLYYPAIENAKIQPLSAMALAAANAFEALALDKRVDPRRIGVMGHSYGGKWAMFAGCLYDKFACAALGDPGIVFDETKGGYINYWEPWYLGYYPPPWQNTWNPDGPTERRGAYATLVGQGHDLHELLALMAPRPLLISGGYADGAERLPVLAQTLHVYNLYGVTDRLAFTMRADHAPDQTSNSVIYDFFTHFLSDSNACHSY